MYFSNFKIGHVSKFILQDIVKELKNKLKYNLWINTMDAIKWFEKIPDKETSTFIQFDICEFYPSITEKILDDTIEFAKNISKYPKKKSGL